ncbi:MAG: DUF721 domain-containing protein [Gammaproteobacteria bacterium]|nr:DUF721 domain-containing protein [Gammaproteobacteria bacterium]
MRFKTVKQVLARQSGQMGRLLEKVDELNALDRLVKSCLDPFLIPHCQVANLRSGCLVMMAESAAWATRLRYTFPDLLSRLRYEARLFNVTSLQCVIQKNPPIHSQVAHATLSLSAENAALFAAMAQEEPDPLLAAAFKKLSLRGME